MSNISHEIIEHVAMTAGMTVQDAMDAMQAFVHALPTFQNIVARYDQTDTSQTESDGVQSQAD